MLVSIIVIKLIINLIMW